MRSEARETAFKIVFADLFHSENSVQFRKSLYKKDKLNEEESAFAERLVLLVEEHKDELLARITEKVERFAEHRIYHVDKAVMLIALAEITYCEDIPPVVSVSEAASIARKYSTENSANFVNGVLGGFINQ